MPFIKPFTTAYGTITGRRTLLVRLEDADGAVGWGEAPIPDRPTYAADTLPSAWFALTDLLLPPLLGMSFSGPVEATASWSRYEGQRYAKHAAECALWALASVRLGLPLRELVGGVHEVVPVGESFGIPEDRDVVTLLREVEARVAEGFCRIKIKIEPGWDDEPLRAVADAFPRIPLTADANGAYRPEVAEHRQALRSLDGLGMQMLEQPYPAHDLLALADLQRELATPICLDESASSLGVTEAALELGAGRVVNVKPARLGGLADAVAVHDLCRSRDIPVWCGGVLESGIGRGFNLAVASLPGFTLPADMSPARLFYEEDLVEPTFDIRSDGTVAVPDIPGVGFPVSEERIDRRTARTWSSNQG